MIYFTHVLAAFFGWWLCSRLRPVVVVRYYVVQGESLMPSPPPQSISGHIAAVERSEFVSGQERGLMGVVEQEQRVS